VSGALLALAFPPYGLVWAFPFALIPWAAALICETRPWRGLLSGAVFGLVFWGMSVPWISFVVTHFGGQPAWMGPVCVLIVALMLAQWPAFLGGILVAALPVQSRSRAIAFPILWLASEHGRSIAYKGFPWNLAAYALFRHPFWLQSARVWGAYGVGALAAGAAAAVAGIVLFPSRRGRLGAAAAAAGIVAVAAIFGAFPRPEPPGARVTVACIQPNIPQSEKGVDELRQRHYAQVIALAREAAARHPGVILIPESSLPVTWQRSATLREDLGRVAAECRCDVLFNDIDEESEDTYYNSARLLTPGGLAPATYRKVHLVPFGEYMPFPRVFFFMRSVSQVVGAFTAARDPVLLEDGALRIGPAVCYEMTYESLPRRETLLGANLLATVSNDAWYGRAGAQEQHFAAMVPRAIENGRFFARAAITGISGVVDDRGRILAELSPDRAGILAVPVRLRTGRTPYTRFGLAVPLAADAFAAAVLISAIVRRYKR
jgi:apolipoprotein N-acyltransferase